MFAMYRARLIGAIVTLAVAVGLSAPAIQAQGLPGTPPLPQGAPSLVVPVNSGRLLNVQNLQRVVVAAPEIADVNVITRNQVMVIGKRLGETTLTLWSDVGISTYRVVVAAAGSADLTRTLRDVLGEPDLRVTVVGGIVVLEGTVSTDDARIQAVQLASGFGKVVDRVAVQRPNVPPAVAMGQQLSGALHDYPNVSATIISPDTVRVDGMVETGYDRAAVESIAKAYAKNVVMMVRVRNPVEIQIATVVAEINRTAMNNIGISYGGGTPQTNSSTTLTGNGGAATTSSTTTTIASPGLFNFGLFTAPNQAVTALQTLVAQLNFLQQRNAARTLANPQLVVLDGQAAKLLVGGEVPIPTVTTNGQTTITYKEFGVRLEFKPQAQPGAPINLDLLTEVSNLDFSQAIVANGFTIPTIRSRRAETVVAMEPGQFLAIGGLIQNVDTKAVNKLPLLGDIPILGELFRSTTFQRGESELVIFVVPTIVRPSSTPPPTPPMPDPERLNP